MENSYSTDIPRQKRCARRRDLDTAGVVAYNRGVPGAAKKPRQDFLGLDGASWISKEPLLLDILLLRPFLTVVVNQENEGDRVIHGSQGVTEDLQSMKPPAIAGGLFSWY